jgi:D-alanyl-D-alanine carboxypeptidase
VAVLSTDPKYIQKKYTKVAPYYDEYGKKKWTAHINIDHQSFAIVDDRSKKDALWYTEMASIALARMIDNEKSTG